MSDLEELDFAAGSDADSDPILDSLKESFGLDPNEELTPEKKLAFMDWLQKQRGSGGMGADDDEEVEDEDDDFDFDESWKTAGLEEDELDDLLADADEGDLSSDEIELPVDKPKKVKKSKSKAEGSSSDKKKKSKKAKAEDVEPEPTPVASFTPLAEPAFKSSKSKKSVRSLSADDDTLGDATSLLEADASDKERRTKSLRFHTSKIASTSNRRAAARAQRLGGDEDVPYRDRQKARDAALRKNSGGQDGGEELDGTEWTESDKKRAREVRDEAGDDLDDRDGDGMDDGAGEYYDLVKRRKTEKLADKEAAHEARQAEKLYVPVVYSQIRVSDWCLVLPSRTKPQMVRVLLPEPSKRIVDLRQDGTRLAGILESKREWHTKRPSKRSGRRGLSTRVGRLLSVETMREKRRVSRLSSSRGSSDRHHCPTIGSSSFFYSYLYNVSQSHSPRCPDLHTSTSPKSRHLNLVSEAHAAGRY